MNNPIRSLGVVHPIPQVRAQRSWAPIKET